MSQTSIVKTHQVVFGEIDADDIGNVERYGNGSGKKKTLEFRICIRDGRIYS